MDECHNATPTMWQLVPASSRTSTTLFSANWPNAREYKEKLPIKNLECWSRMIATNKWGLTSSLQNKIWSLPDQSIILPKFIKKESLPDQRKFCQSGSVARHLFWRLDLRYVQWQHLKPSHHVQRLQSYIHQHRQITVFWLIFSTFLCQKKQTKKTNKLAIGH